MIVRTMLPEEAGPIGELRVGAYRAQDLLAHESGYADELRALGFGGRSTVLVAADESPAGSGSSGAGSGDGSGLLGTVMYEPWHPGCEVARSPGEAEVRAFAVAPWAQGRGTGRALMRAVIDRVTASGAARLVLSTQPAMEAARHLYVSLGFTRVPERDWAPTPGVTLLAFALPLA
jgi:ribosomal protein S18 acetylase RimI-like enzyme